MAGPFQHFYPFAPVWAQTLGISLYGLSWRKERLGGRFEEYVTGFREREGWSADRFQDFLRTELRGTLLQAISEVPYYRERWASLGLSPESFSQFEISDLSRLPTTPKQALRDGPGEFISPRAARFHRLRKFHSSGTTGTPVTAVCSCDGRRKFMAGREARSFGWAGTSIRKPRSMIGGRMVVPKGDSGPPFHRYNWAEKQVYFSAFHISPQNAPHYVAALNRYQPLVFTGYAYSHYLLARMMLDQGLRLDYQPEALVLSSEKLTPEMKLTLRQAFGARAYEEYGCVENCGLATECEQGRLHVNPDFGILEIVDDLGRPVPAGVAGRILGTSLLNEAQPLIRYEIGDLGTWSEESCPCGRNHLPVLKEVVGRLEDVVTGPDGRQMVRFHGIFIDLPGVMEGQVVQENANQFTVRIVAGDGFDESQARTIRTRFEERLGKVLVRIERVSEIPRTERGKFRAVVSNTNA